MTLMTGDQTRSAWEELARRREAQRAAAATTSPDEARVLAEVAESDPNLDPGVAVSVARMAYQNGVHVDPDRMRALLTQASRLQAVADEGGWKQRLYSGLKGTVRGGLTLLTYPQQVLARGVTSLSLAADRASADDPTPGTEFLGMDATEGVGLPLAVGARTIGSIFRNIPQTIGNIPEAYADAPQPYASIAAGQLRQTGRIDLGEGFLPGGRVMETYHKQRNTRAVLSSTGLPADVPSLFTQASFEDPHSRAAQVAESLFTIAWEIGSDPLLAVDSTIRAGQSAKVFTGGTEDLHRYGLIHHGKGGRKSILPEVTVDHWLKGTRSGRSVVEWLAEQDDFHRIFSRVRHTPTALRLQEATTTDEVIEVLSDVLGREVRIAPTTPMTARLARTLDNSPLARITSAISDALPSRSTYARIGTWTPGDAIPLRDPDLAVEQFSRELKNAMFAKADHDRLVEEMARAVTSDNPIGRGWAVFEESRRVLRKNLSAEGFDPDIVKRVTEIHGGDQFRTGADIRSYLVESSLDPRAALPVEFPGTRRMADGTPLPTPFMLTQMMDETIPLHHTRDLRRMTGAWSRLSKVPVKFPEGFENLGYQGDLGGALGYKNFLVDVGWAVTKAWTPVQLVTRLAWPLRVVTDEQVRIALVGADAIFNHPISYLAYALGKKGSLDAFGDPLADSIQHQRAMVHRMKAITGNVDPRLGHPHWAPVNKNASNLSKKQRVQAWHINLSQMWSDPVMQEVARALSGAVETVQQGGTRISRIHVPDKGTPIASLSNVKEWFFNGQGFKHRQRMNESLLNMQGRPSFHLVQKSDSDAWVDEAARQIIRMTGGDPELIEAIATGTFRGHKVGVADSFNSFKARAVQKELRGKYDEFAPDWMSAPETLLEGTASNVGMRKVFDEVVNRLWTTLGAIPSNTLSRNPLFNHLYWSRMKELVEWATPEVQEQIIKGAREAGFGSGVSIDLFPVSTKVLGTERLAKRGKKFVEEMEETARKVNQMRGGQSSTRLILSLDEADHLAKTDALYRTNRLLYNLSEKGQTAEALRAVVPFFEPNKEILTTYSRLLARNPLLFRRGAIAYEGVRETGFIYTDPQSGQDVYATPASGLATAAIFDLAFPGLPSPILESEQVTTDLPRRTAGVNLVTGSGFVPGVGPVIQWPAAAFLPDHPKFNDLREFLLPFGSGIEEPGDLIDPGKIGREFIPAWLRKVVLAVNEDVDEVAYNSLVADSMRALNASGRYSNDKAGRQKLEEDARRLARSTYIFRAIGQAISLTGFDVEWRQKVDSPDAEKAMREVLGEEAKLGKTDRGFFTTSVLGAFYRELLDRTNDPFVAHSTFMELLGFDPEDVADLYHTRLLVQGKTRAIGREATTHSGVEWIRSHPEYRKKFPTTFGFWAPETGPERDIDEFFRSIDEGTRISLTPDQFVSLANQTIASMIYQAQAKKVEGRSDSEARAWKAQWRQWLDSEFPGWRFDVPGLPAREERSAMRDELIRAVTTEPELAKTPQGRALATYLERRDAALDSLLRPDDGVVTRDQATGTLSMANLAAPTRSWLRGWGEWLVLQHPEFAPMWEEVWLPEVEEPREEEEVE